MKPDFICPCCGEYVFPEGPGSHDICPVCGWEDDRIQFRAPELAGGANRLSLNAAREQYQVKVRELQDANQ